MVRFLVNGFSFWGVEDRKLGLEYVGFWAWRGLFRGSVESVRVGVS